MVSPAGRRNKSTRLARRIRFASLYHTARLIGLLLLWIAVQAVMAQSSNPNIQVELVTETNAGEALLHVRLPRGQTVEEAILTQDDLEITLIVDPIPLPITQFIVIDASAEMVNMQSVVQSSVPRLWNTGTQESSLTSLIFYANDAIILAPTNRIEDVDNRLAEYTVNSGETACLNEALDAINAITRDYNRAWRILIITVGDFSRQSICNTNLLATAPSLLDVIAITDNIDPLLQDLVDRSGGQFYNANLRLVEARTNEVLSAWSQPSYSLHGDIPDGWDRDASFEFEIRISNDLESRQILSFRDYNVPVAATATPEPSPTEDTTSETAEATAIVANPIPATAMPNVTDNDDSDGDNNSVAVLLIVGAVLFVVGAVILALALSRVRRAPVDVPSQANPSFYETLDSIQRESEEALSATRVRERNIISSPDDEPQTKISPLDDTQMVGIDDDNDQDELILTQVLSDERFRSMMKQASTNNEIVGWIRLIVVGQNETHDFELTASGAVVGRSQECDIQITGDRAISRKHARIDVRGNRQVTVSRLSAVNPVVVGGIQISNRHPLAPNDVIHLSDETRLIFIANEDLDDEADITQF